MFELGFKMMKFKPLITGASMAFLMVAATTPRSFATDSLEIRNFVGTINWSNGPLSVDVTKNADDTKITGRRTVVVDGGQNDIDGSDCKSAYGRYNFDWFGKKKEGRFGGYKNLEDLPVLEIALPETLNVIVKNAIIFTDGSPNIKKADLELRHCGEVTLGDVDGVLALDSRGSTDVTVGNTGQIVANLNGSGDLTGSDSGEVLIKSNGSGDVELENIASFEASSHGSGDLIIGDVDGSVELSSNGSGDVDLGEINGSLSFSGHGSGDLDVASVHGVRLDLESRGSGDVDIGAGQVNQLTAILSGSASVEFSGEAETATLRSSGSGDIYVNRVTGLVEIKSSGSGEVDIDERD